ncbi:MAG: Protein translocase subunit SecY [Candidatus Nomurabacteria bacterium GW2011_GWE1_32_28]|uniref:Protein translocase subunit SecY n=1 Tax=Candidatus Nomurabacteria bacterium GW2011_GWF1_31_48 TaxID=1618767 RepID=A0A0F9YF25_9BACT|nr:MAG: Protein translocase subunit SecY [Candidatus Nomurabacteria bacterium GW2011_GWF2_30_133]KKP28702.1 MAG: Protein translocase subunit SecY [Candidatus Nomurabacteria bacterium GW2011_GWE2_31_40]KKP30279.1 MAG: Protein translocase subunit SecY [Candidatus Nomurabacteria bacterium GW2011_GWF1_31_48]KKP34806.1 MAG: Protein translocase subunit SecY [Candidatus Nomurabacteria bacterium GW2011_GWE1_32_28]HAS80736.1 preprotein translocase subunit SecY [Candidatus Nomurabacteria bacterium]
MKNFWNKIKLIWTDTVLRKRVLFVLFSLVIFRLLSSIPIPGIDTLELSRFLTNNQFFGILNIFSGGGLSNLSIIMLGVGPYITSSIIMQLLTIMIPALKRIYHEEGEAGRKRFTQYSRLLTIPLAAIQGFSLLAILESQKILVNLTVFDRVTNIIIVIAGSMLLMWIGELMSEFGIGNGVSLIIFAGIISQLPTEISQLIFTFDVSQIPLFLLFIVAGALVVAGVVVVTEAERPIPVTYAKRVRGAKMYGGGSTYLPLRVNQAGVIPIIFALSLLMFPQMIGTFLASSSNSVLLSISKVLMTFSQTSVVYAVLYFILVFLFTYFYTAVTFDPEALATNLQKNGAFIPGIRPGVSTSLYISKVLSRITLLGATFLGFIAVLPLIVRSLTGISAIALGGTALLIVVSVVLDLIKKVDAQISMREY